MSGDAARALVADHFDADYYLDSGPDLGPAGDALSHFMSRGWKEGRSPSAEFDVSFYLAAYPDVAAAGMNPLVHYLRWGKAEGRRPRGRDLGKLVAVHFDAEHYRGSRPDLPAVVGDPLAHFLAGGWRDGRSPSAAFDVPFYLACNPDVAAAGVNPLLHWLEVGQAEGRPPRKPRDAWRARLDAAGKPRARGPVAVGPAGRAPAGEVARRVGEASVARGLVVSVSHDDAAAHCGGVQSVIGGEQRAFAAIGRGYLHVAPVFLSGVLAEDRPLETALLSLRLNGDRLGIVSVAELVEAVRAVGGNRRVQLVVHHLAGHAPEHVLALARACGDVRPVFWVHDYFTICPSPFLLRNDVTFCGAPAASSAACGICCHGEARSGHLSRVGRLFAETRPTVLAPSESALRLWRAGGLGHGEAAVVPLARLEPGPRTPTTGPTLKIAHVGAPSFHKGWHVFEALAARLAGTPGYQLLQLGAPAADASLSPIASVPVLVDPGDPGAMARAVAEQRIDVVVSWSLCHETFSFTTHEALAGGAFVIARAGSGNVWPAVLANAPHQGFCVADEAALVRLFEGDALRSLLAKAERRRFSLIPGRATADWIS